MFRRDRLSLLASVFLAIAAPAVSAQQVGDDGAGAPASAFVQAEMEGFGIWVPAAPPDARQVELDRALDHLRAQLRQVTRVVPGPLLAELRRVPIWVQLDSKTACAAYHPSRRWLLDHGYAPPDGVQSAFEIGNPRNFLSWTLHQPWMVLHELAHGYNHLGLAGGDGYRSAPLEQRFREVADTDLYQRVLGHQGRPVRHYGLSNHMEFFAEATESFFGVNDFYPFVRAELRRYDPETHALLEKIWADDGARLRDGWRRGPDPRCRPTISTRRSPSSIVGQAAMTEARTIEGVPVKNAPREVSDTEAASGLVELMQVRLQDARRRIPAHAWRTLEVLPWHLEGGRSGDVAWRSPLEKTAPSTFEVRGAAAFDARADARPGLFLHLYAHAWHELGLDDDARASVRSAFERSRDAGLYDRVLRLDGEEVASPALLDPDEFFATLSAAWLGVSDHFPFVRAELRQHDPESCALIARLWAAPEAK